MILISFATAFTAVADGNPRSEIHTDSTLPRKEGALLKLINKELDLGQLHPNTARYGKIKFINAGDSVLVLKSVRGNCGCTVVRFNTDSIMPDSVGSIEVRFDSHGRPPGKFRKMIRIRSTSQRRIDVAFISGTVLPSR